MYPDCEQECQNCNTLTLAKDLKGSLKANTSSHSIAREKKVKQSHVQAKTLLNTDYHDNESTMNLLLHTGYLPQTFHCTSARHIL